MKTCDVCGEPVTKTLSSMLLHAHNVRNIYLLSSILAASLLDPAHVLMVVLRRYEMDKGDTHD